jgi:hypothetical protein
MGWLTNYLLIKSIQNEAKTMLPWKAIAFWEGQI